MEINFEKLTIYLKNLGVIECDTSNLNLDNLEEFILGFLNTPYRTTPSFKRRSVGDLFRIALNVFPNINIEDIYDSLYNLMENRDIVSYICQSSHIRVYRNADNNDGGFKGAAVDEYGFLPEKFKSLPTTDKYYYGSEKYLIEINYE